MSTRDDRVDAVFAALADPTRRRLLAASEPVTRQAVVKHLQSLDEAGLVTPSREGREVRYAVTAAPLEDAVGWMVTVGAQWDRRLARLRRRLGGGK
jgi:DNA-binding transcriptional ArsR family regulator